MDILSYVISKVKRKKTTLNNFEIADIIDDFISLDCQDRWAWDDFISIKSKDPKVEKIRQHIFAIEDKYPPKKTGMWCSEDGLHELSDLAKSLRNGSLDEEESKGGVLQDKVKPQSRPSRG